MLNIAFPERPTLVTVPAPAFAHEGVLPLLVNTLPFAPIASLVKVVVVFAYKISPTAYPEIPVPPFVAPTVPEEERLLLASVNTGEEAVREETFIPAKVGVA